MSDTVALRMEGFEKLGLKLNKAADVRLLTKAVLKPAAEHIRDEAAIEPPEPAPTNPKYKYVRGSGTKYVPTGRIRHTSEVLGKRWFVGVRQDLAIIHNYATYAGHVHGKRQARWRGGGHKQTGWKQLHEVAKDELPKIGRKVIEAFRRQMRS